MNQPIVLWLLGIGALVLLLVLGGGFRRPVAMVVIAVFVVALITGFVLLRRARR